MLSVVPSEFDSMSTGARSGASTSTWIGQPSALTMGMVTPSAMLRATLSSCRQAARQSRNSAQRMTKALCSRPADALYRDDSGSPRTTEKADGDDHEWASPTAREPRGGMGQAQRPGSAQELHSGQRAA